MTCSGSLRIARNNAFAGPVGSHCPVNQKFPLCGLTVADPAGVRARDLTFPITAVQIERRTANLGRARTKVCMSSTVFESWQQR